MKPPPRSLLLLLLLLPSPAPAHDFWIEWQRTAAGIDWHMCVGERMQGDERALTLTRASRAEWIDGTGKVDLMPMRDEASLPPSLPARARDGVIVYASLPSDIALEASRFEPYLVDEGQDEVLRRRREAGRQAEVGYERYARAAKALVGGAAPSVAAFPSGLRFEIVPEEDPRQRAGSGWFAVRILWEGRPLAGAAVRELHRPPGGLVGEVLAEERTDAEGRVGLPLAGPGLYLVKSLRMVAAEPDAGADWLSTWASLTFVIE